VLENLDIANASSLEKRLVRLEDVEAIQRVMLRYAEGMDNNFDADAIAACFTADAKWSIQPSTPATGTHHGRDEIRNFFAGLKSVYTWTMHNMTNAMIDVADDGESAMGTFYLVDPCEIIDEKTGEPQAAFIAGRYRNTFVKIDGAWYIKELSAAIHHIGSWDEGWLRKPLLATEE